jgi:hypothetical protein
MILIAPAVEHHGLDVFVQRPGSYARADLLGRLDIAAVFTVFSVVDAVTSVFPVVSSMSWA